MMVVGIFFCDNAAGWPSIAAWAMEPCDILPVQPCCQSEMEELKSLTKLSVSF